MSNNRLARIISALVCLLILAFISFFEIYNKKKKNYFFSNKWGIRFDFPKGWTPLTSDNMKKMFPGKDGTTFAISDPDYTAIFSIEETDIEKKDTRVINHYFNLLKQRKKGKTQSISLNEAEEKVTAYYAILLASIKMAFARSHEKFEILDEGVVTLGGIPVAAIIFMGKMPGEETQWKQLIVMLPKHSVNKILMVRMSVPWEAQEEFEKDFLSIKNSWTWK